MIDRKDFNLAMVFGLLLLLSAALVGLIQASPVQAASAAPAGPTARPWLMIPPALPPGEPLHQVPVLTITKQADPNPVNAGDVLTYTIVVYNGGDAPATDLVITDVLDSGVSFVWASDGGGEDSGVVGWALSSVAVNETITRSLRVTVNSNVPAATSLSNTASVTSTQGAHDSVTMDSQVQASADLSITKSSSTPTAVAGTSFSYTLSVSNNGPSDASGVVISDTLPAGLSFRSSGSSNACTASGQLVTCSVNSLAADQTVDLTVVVDAAASLPAGTVSNTVSVEGSQPDPLNSNNSSTETINVSREADLSITKSGSTPSVVAGASFSYNLSVTNDGPSDASGLVISDTLPSGLSFRSSGSSGGCTASSQLVTCSISSLTAHHTVDLTIVVDVASGLADGTQLHNTADVEGTEPDPDDSNNSATETTTVNRPADLRITKTASVDSVVAGTSFSYDLSVRNNGPLDASGITVSDTLPAGLSFRSSGSSSGCAASGQLVTCSLNSLSAYHTVHLTIVVDVAAWLPAGTVSNTASVEGNEPDPNGSNNSSTETTNVSREADLRIIKSGSTPTVVAGTSFSYNLSVRNNGPSDASGITVSDTLPAGLSFRSSGSSSGCSASGQLVTCSISSLTADHTVGLTIVVDVAASLSAGTVSNTASVSGSQTDPNSSNNSSTETTDVSREADLRITKSDSVDPAAAGTSFSYNLSVTNNGPSDASGITISDALSAGLSFESSGSSSQCSAVGQQVTCSISSLTAGSMLNRTIVVNVAASLVDGLQLNNTASVSGSQTDPSPGNNSGSQGTTVTRKADLEVSLGDSADPVGIGASFTYHITVINNGPSDASGVRVSDTLPAELSFNPSGSSSECGVVGQQVTCDIGPLAAGHDVTLAVVVDVDDSLADGTLLSNTVVVSANETDPSGGNDSATEATLTKVFKTYLPLILRTMTELSVFNENTGGNVTFTVVEAGVSCTVPNNTTQFCGSFEPGTYTVQVTSPCGYGEFIRTYASGPVTTRVFCQ
jgi:uncharacterized repeat protein (TIGR01451 family)